MKAPEELFVKQIPSVNGGYCFLTRTREQKLAHSILYVNKEMFIKKTMEWIKQNEFLYFDCHADYCQFMRDLKKAMEG